MALLFMDSFDHYTVGNNTTDILKKWSTGYAIVTAGGRTGSNYIRTNTIRKVLNSNITTGIAGFAFRTGAPSPENIFSFSEGVSLTKQCWLTLTLDGRLTLGSGSTTYFTSDPIISLNVWYYIEIKATIHNTTGSMYLRVNGVDIGNVTGVNTRQTANNYLNSFIIGEREHRHFDDLYFCDTSGSINNDFLGDVKIECLFPDSDGTFSDFTPVPSGTHYSKVNQTAPDDDTTYVYTDAAKARDSYGYQNLITTSGSIYAIQVIPYARKDDAGSRSIADFVYVSGIIYSGEVNSIGNTYNYFTNILETNPATSSSWTIPEVNSLEVGIELVK